MRPDPAQLPAVLGLPGSLRRLARQPVVIRELRPGDEAQVQAFFYSHTPDTLYDRYGCLVSTMTAERAAALVNVDRARDHALGIFTGPEGRLDAIGRYCHDAHGAGAELAFVVRETMRRQGMATTLLHHLIAAAKTHGLTRLWAQVNSANAEMLGIFQRQGFTLTPEPDNGIMRATRGLTGAGAGPEPRSKIREALAKGRSASRLCSAWRTARM